MSSWHFILNWTTSDCLVPLTKWDVGASVSSLKPTGHFLQHCYLPPNRHVWFGDVNFHIWIKTPDWLSHCLWWQIRTCMWRKEGKVERTADVAAWGRNEMDFTVSGLVTNKASFTQRFRKIHGWCVLGIIPGSFDFGSFTLPVIFRNLCVRSHTTRKDPV